MHLGPPYVITVFISISVVPWLRSNMYDYLLLFLPVTYVSIFLCGAILNVWYNIEYI